MKPLQPPKKLWEHPRDLMKIRNSVYETSAGNTDSKKYWRGVLQEIEANSRRYESTPDPTVLKELFRNKGKEFFKDVFNTDEVDVTNRTLRVCGSKRTPLEKTNLIASRSCSDTSELESFHAQFKARKMDQLSLASLGSCRSTFRRSHLDPALISKLTAKLVVDDKRTAPEVLPSDQSVDWLSTESIRTTSLKSSSTENLVKRVRLANNNLSGSSPGKKLKLSNPHYDMLRKNKSEDDMINWNSKYRPPQLMSDDMAQELREKAKDRMKFKQIEDFMKENFTWNPEEDQEFLEQVEELFKIKFIKLPDTTFTFIAKEFPFPLDDIAKYCGVPERSKTESMKRLLKDGEAAYKGIEKKVAFGKSLPQHLKRIVRKRSHDPWNVNHTPDAVKDIKLVFDGITNLEAVQRYHDFLKQRGEQVPGILNEAYQQKNVVPRKIRKPIKKKKKN